MNLTLDIAKDKRPAAIALEAVPVPTVTDADEAAKKKRKKKGLDPDDDASSDDWFNSVPRQGNSSSSGAPTTGRTQRGRGGAQHVKSKLEFRTRHLRGLCG